MLKDIVNAIRPHHYIKNILVFLPVFFADTSLFLRKFPSLLIGFLSFSLLSSSIYIFNDIQDVDADKNHEVKSKRPIASGAITKKTAAVLSLLCLFASLLMNYFTTTEYRNSFLVLGGYLFINMIYSLGLKNVPFLDVTILAIGFLLRIFYGSIIAEIAISEWLLLAILSMSFYLSFGKRRNEFIKQGFATRKVLRFYNKKTLDIDIHLCLILTMLFYSIWCFDLRSSLAIPPNSLFSTIPIVGIILFRYHFIIDGDSHGDPVDVLLKDKIIQGLVILYSFVMFLLFW